LTKHDDGQLERRIGGRKHLPAEAARKAVPNGAQAQTLRLKKNMLGQNLTIAGNDYAGPLENVAQFTDVSRPVVPFKGFTRSRAQRHSGAELRQKSLSETAEVSNALAQGRKVDWENRQSIVQILPKQVLLHKAMQIGVRRCYYPHIHLQIVVPAYSLHFSLLQKTEDFALQRERHVPNLVQEECSPVRRMNAAYARLDRSGE
jgi:hypothetical protein